jgi:hypothetical protein
MYRMVPLYVFETEIYYFLANYLQFAQIRDLNPIDTKSDSKAHLSALTWQ